MGCIDPSWRPELALNLERLGLAAQTVLGRGGLLENQEVNAPLDVADGRQMASRPRPCVPFALSRPGTPGQGSALHGLRLAPLMSSEPLRAQPLTSTGLPNTSLSQGGVTMDFSWCSGRCREPDFLQGKEGRFWNKL